jgi:hypothetical protein
MHNRGLFGQLAIAVIVMVLAACGSNTPGPVSGPVLVGENTLVPTTPAPTRLISMTPEPSATPRNREVLSPLDVATVEADFVLVTPTLPPSKTPSQTPTFTATPTTSPTPTATVTATATLPLFPTSVIIPVTAPVANPLPQVCDSTWSYLYALVNPPPSGCPRSAPLASQGVYQAFQNGHMVWIGSMDVIYVLYSDQMQPRWLYMRDDFDEGMAEDDPAYAESPYERTWQPRRGFGLLWRTHQEIRDRIGWAIDEWEQPFSVVVQQSADGTLFIDVENVGVFSLLPGGTNWTRYASAPGF